MATGKKQEKETYHSKDRTIQSSEKQGSFRNMKMQKRSPTKIMQHFSQGGHSFQFGTRMQIKETLSYVQTC